MFIREEKRDAFGLLGLHSKFDTMFAEHTRRAFHGIFSFFSIHYVDMSYIMHLRVFQRGKLLQCEVATQ